VYGVGILGSVANVLEIHVSSIFRIIVNIEPACSSETLAKLLNCSLHLRMERDPVSETLCFLVFRIPDDGQSPEPQ
jgi:hypothetical protein